MEIYIPKCNSGEGGVILNVSSLAGLQPMLQVTTYSATKSALITIGRAYGDANNFEKTNCRIVTLCPGPIKTLLYESIMSRDDPQIAELKKFAEAFPLET